ncbi:hypothetical protein CYMTET_11452, partial [Cymbomonas tetramitiformis]
EEAHTVWATLCVVARCRSLPFAWVLNPEDPPEERETISTVAATFLGNAFLKTALNSRDVVEMEAAATHAVDTWNKGRLEVIRKLKWEQAAQQSRVALPLQSTNEPKLTRWERTQESLRQLKALVRMALNYHPWMRIFVISHEEAYTRAQRIFVQGTSILLMLTVCIMIYYSKAAQCCAGLRTAVGCDPEEGTECLGFTSCAELMNNDPLTCSDFACDAVDPALPSGYTCTAFPQAKLVDELWLAIFVVIAIVTIQLSFQALFTIGGTIVVPRHWDTLMAPRVSKLCGRGMATFVQNLVFLLYTLLFDNYRISRAIARFLRAWLFLLNGFYQLTLAAAPAARRARRQLAATAWFLYQTRVLGRSKEQVHMDLRLRLQMEEDSLASQGMGHDIFDQVWQEMDSLAVQMAYALLLLAWATIAFVLLVYVTQLRLLMGAEAEQRVLKAWVLTLIMDNLVLNVLVSTTVKLFVQELLKAFKSQIRNAEEELMLWFEGYLNVRLAPAYQLVATNSDDNTAQEAEYDAAGQDF